MLAPSALPRSLRWVPPLILCGAALRFPQSSVLGRWAGGSGEPGISAAGVLGMFLSLIPPYLSRGSGQPWQQVSATSPLCPFVPLETAALSQRCQLFS